MIIGLLSVVCALMCVCAKCCGDINSICVITKQEYNAKCDDGNFVYVCVAFNFIVVLCCMLEGCTIYYIHMCGILRNMFILFVVIFMYFFVVKRVFVRP